MADKHDSQDICFVPTGRYTDVIERLQPNAMLPGDIVDLDGRVIGRHQGIAHFTVGQRRGSRHRVRCSRSMSVRLDASSRRVVVGPREALRMRRIALREVGTGSATVPLDRLPAQGLEMFVKVRSTRRRSRPGCAVSDGGYEIELVDGEEGVSPGQACVFYDAPTGQARGARRWLHRQRGGWACTAAGCRTETGAAGRRHALEFFLSMICSENRFPRFRIGLENHQQGGGWERYRSRRRGEGVCALGSGL